MRIVDVRLTGHLTQSALEAALEDAGRRMGNDTCAMVLDCLEMTDYDLDARHAFVDWQRTYRGKVAAVAILTTKMAWHLVISAMALASGQKMRPFDDRTAAQAWLLGAK